MIQLRRKIAVLCPFVATALLLLAQVPWTDTVSYQRFDEGYNGCMVASLARGYRLYADLWLDQPPLFFLTLRLWLGWFGISLLKGRVLVFLTSILFAGLFFDIIRRRAGEPAAWLALVLLATRQIYAMMSVCMIQELPAYMCAALALWLITLRPTSRHPTVLLALSAAAMACAVLTKLSVAPMALLILFELALGEASRAPNPRLKARNILVWVLGTSLGVWLVGRWTGVDFYRLLAPHVQPMETAFVADRSGTRYLPIFAQANWILLLMSLPAVHFGLRLRERAFFLPLLWLAVSVVLLNLYQPVWDHYELHIVIPLCWLAGLATSRAVAGRWLIVAYVAALAAIPSNRTELRSPAWQISNGALAAVHEYAPATRWMAAIESQIYPFLAGVPVIPELYTTSLKRSLVGDMRVAIMADLIRRYEPEQLLFDYRFAYPPELAEFLQSRYRARFPDSLYMQWVRRDIAHPGSYWAADPFEEAIMSRNEARIKPYPLALHFLNIGQLQNAKRLLQLALRIRSPAIAAHQQQARALLAEITREEGRIPAAP